jgi:RHS repeat-associated protein
MVAKYDLKHYKINSCLRSKYVDYQPKVSSKHACKHLRKHVNHRTLTTTVSTTRYQPTTLTWTASYDSRDRLTALVRSNTSSRYSYDPNSNRLSSVAQTIADTNGNASFEPTDTAANTSQALTTESSSNRLLGFTQSITSVRGTQTLSTVNSAVNYSLDAAGNLSSDGLRAFAYDATNRHTSTRSPAGADTAHVQYLFNALGQRVFKSVVSLSSGTGVVSGGTTATGSITPMPTLGQFYSYADDSEGAGNSSSGSNANLPSYAMLGEYCNGASGCVQQEYLWLPLDNGQAIPVGLLRSSRLYAIHTDHLGTPRLIHDDSNTPVWQWAYSAFGENIPTGALKATTNVNSVFALGANNAKLAVSAPGITVNLRFPGQYFDSESNLHQNYFRSYDPKQGRYTQSDPIGLDGGLNRFGYVGGNALSRIDPMGLDWQEKFDAVKSVGVSGAMSANDAATQALDIANTSGLSGLHNGPADAFRHCVWSCTMTREIGETGARAIGNQHEDAGDRGGQPAAERNMDQSNNAEGRACGVSNDTRSCPQMCMDKYMTGRLHGLSGNPIPAPPRPNPQKIH